MFTLKSDIINNVLFCCEEAGFDNITAWVKFEGGEHFVNESISYTMLMDYGIIYDYYDCDNEEDCCDEVGDAIAWLMDRDERKERLGF